MRYTMEEIYSKKDKKEKQKKIIRILINMIIIPLIIYNIIILIQLFAFSDVIPSFFGYKNVIITSSSMSPELETGDIVVSKKVSENELNKGDIITFKEGDIIVTHRIEEISDGKYQTKGDSNVTNDLQLVEFKNVEGKYVFKISKLGNIVIFLQDKMGILVLTIFAYIIYSIIKNRKETIMKRKEKRKTYEAKH